MRYSEFERIISAERMSRYVEACGGNTRKAMTLYRYNAELAQTVFPIIGFFEVALRNEYVKILSLLEWLGIDSKKYLYGLDHVMVSDKIDKLKPA